MSSSNTIENLSQMMDKMGLTELKTESSFLFGLFRKEIHLSKQSAAVAAVSVPAPTFAAAAAPQPLAKAPGDDAKNPAAAANALRSPMVGVAYLAPEPGAKPFVTVGAKVKNGDTVALIEAMKTFNPVKSDRDGVVTEILVTEGQAVEFDTPLVVIE
ncbi:MAG: acetyl-CoA carboxylase biotin carboxyl carrier protein [Proteobacteria bacterium]|nr:acetyl-CoA carboxylase biotin carboxyl carrier protein [Pseudomonadota bacterium]